jgi:hypothetical protein
MRAHLYRVSLMVFCIISLIGTALPAAAEGESAPDPSHDPVHPAEHIEAPQENEQPPPVVPRRQESLLGWILRSCGLFGQMIPVTAMVCFVLTVFITMRGDGPFAIVAILLIVPIPLLVGVIGSILGLISSFQVIAASAIAPKPSEVADGFATALFTPLLGMTMMLPSYAVATIGGCYRSLLDRDNSTPNAAHL